MEFLKFSIINEKADQQIGTEEHEILINRNHIVSIKPINIMVTEGEVLKGYWIRNSNGKKYKATKIPSELESSFSHHGSSSLLDEEIEETQPLN